MALIKFSSVVSEARGSVGGTTYSRNRGGAYIRSRTTPVQPTSTLQSDAKAVFAAAVNSWTNVLTATERAGWDSYAAAVPYTDTFGSTRYYTGQQRYVQAYTAGVNAGLLATRFATAPTTLTEAANVLPASITINQGASTADATAKIPAITTQSGAVAGDIVIVNFGEQITKAVTYFKGPYRYAAKSTFVSGSTYPLITVTNPYGYVVTAGNLIPYSARVLLADNRISPIIRGILTVGAYSA